MQLPADITKPEMKTLLHKLRAEYLPSESSDFIDQLDEEGLRFTLDVIGEQDESKREQMWHQLEQKIANVEKQKVQLTQHVIQKAEKLILQYRENISQQYDDESLEKLELEF